MTYTTLLFDLDDTLVDFQSAETQSLDLVYQEFFAIIPKCDFLAHFHTINRALWQRVEQGTISTRDVGMGRFQLLVEKLSLTLKADQVSDFYENKLSETTVWLPGAEQCLDTLNQHHKIGIITNGLSRVQYKKHQRLSLVKWCTSFIVSEEVNMAKPDKRIFELALAAIDGHTATTLMIGDSLHSDYQGALNAGLDFCWVNPLGMSLPNELQPPTYIVKSVAELPAIL